VSAGRDEASWASWLSGTAAAIHEAGRWRRVRPFDAVGPVGSEPGGRPLVSFASNDYLGLTTHPDTTAAAHAALDRWGTGSGASRLVVGSRPIHHDLEEALARWRGADAAVVFPTGFAANLGVLAAFAGPDLTVVSDEWNHASIIDGCRLAAQQGAEVVVVPHADAAAVEAALATRAGRGRRGLVVTDAVFSMDGDEAPLDDLVAAAARHGALLVVDEAHAVLGPPMHTGAAAALAAAGAGLVRVGTLSKALGSLGGFVAADRLVVDLLVNRARPFIFTTAPTPADAAAALAAVAIVTGSEGDELRARLRRLVERLAPGHPSPILPVIVGDEQAALDAAEALAARGLLVPAIRPPTVAPGTSRLRIALSAAHTDEQVDALATALGDLDLSVRP
jgi:8-amino-7-oxononanoate synthase